MDCEGKMQKEEYLDEERSLDDSLFHEPFEESGMFRGLLSSDENYFIYVYLYRILVSYIYIVF